MEQAYAAMKTGGKYPLSYEVIYGTAFGPQEGQPRKTAGGDIATFSVDELLKTHRK